jgi:hypothetical protein
MSHGTLLRFSNPSVHGTLTEVEARGYTGVIRHLTHRPDL